MTDRNKNWLTKAGMVTGFIVAVITIATFVVSFIGKMYKRDFIQQEHQKQIEQISRQIGNLQQTLTDLQIKDTAFQSQVNEQISSVEKSLGKRLPAINWWLQENVRAVKAMDKKMEMMIDSNLVR